jgi:hypothetical protein
VHDPLDPEYTILKQRLARRVRYEMLDVARMTLADITAVAERTITDVGGAAAGGRGTAQLAPDGPAGAAPRPAAAALPAAVPRAAAARVSAAQHAPGTLAPGTCRAWLPLARPTPAHPSPAPAPTQDLEYLIEKCVDPKKADYAVVAGVQVHNWGMQFEDHGEPSLEFVAPTKVYVSVNGEKTFLDLMQIPVRSGGPAACRWWLTAWQLPRELLCELPPIQSRLAAPERRGPAGNAAAAAATRPWRSAGSD